MRQRTEKREIKEVTDQKKLTFEVNEQVRLEDPKSKRWDIQGMVRDVRVNNEGTVCSDDIDLANNQEEENQYCTKQ